MRRRWRVSLGLLAPLKGSGKACVSLLIQGRDRSGPPPILILDHQAGAYGAFVGFAMHGSASAYGSGAAASGARWTCAEWWCFRQMSRRLRLPPSLHRTDLPKALLGQLALMYSPFETRHRPAVAAGNGGRNRGARYFPLRLSLTPVCSNAGRTKVFMDPCECGSPGGLG
ncbi:hypothetical protein H6P81_021463 [Aristolochia fimbriata]|uniref:Uncharacterized protein n=1 Tax=Aristolochia fimbriata TaxID=158543 RepID=A0AAV7DQU6_ARIFI|nr:hypothetical protein H6P81_021463 [Aristolochia fimbriata]